MCAHLVLNKVFSVEKKNPTVSLHSTLQILLYLFSIPHRTLVLQTEESEGWGGLRGHVPGGRGWSVA